MASKAKIRGKGGCGTTNSNKSNQSKKPAESIAENNKDKPFQNFRCYRCNGVGQIRDCKKRKQCNTGTSKEGLKDEAFVCEALSVNKDDEWIADSDATDHVIYNGEWFSSFERFVTPVKVYIGDKSTMDALGKGTIKFEALVDEK